MQSTRQPSTLLRNRAFWKRFGAFWMSCLTCILLIGADVMDEHALRYCLRRVPKISCARSLVICQQGWTAQAASKGMTLWSQHSRRPCQGCPGILLMRLVPCQELGPRKFHSCRTLSWGTQTFKACPALGARQPRHKWTWCKFLHCKAGWWMQGGRSHCKSLGRR